MLFSEARRIARFYKRKQFWTRLIMVLKFTTAGEVSYGGVWVTDQLAISGNAKLHILAWSGMRREGGVVMKQQTPTGRGGQLLLKWGAGVPAQQILDPQDGYFRSFHRSTSLAVETRLGVAL